MTTAMITLKLEQEFLKEIDETCKQARYQNRTEFIREALREKLKEIQLRRALAAIEKMRGSATRHVSEEDYEQVRNNPPEHLDSEKLFRLAYGTDIPKK
jgi:Arc/MetJ-type ribon-helix-helix transcriptional regulator